MRLEWNRLDSCRKYVGLMCALLFTVFLQLIVTARSTVPSLDCFTFVRLAQRLAENPVGAIREFDQHPGFSAAMLLAHGVLTALGRDDSIQTWLLAGHIVNGVSGVLCVILVWVLARRLFDHHIADISAFAVAILPEFRQNAADALSDSTHLACYLGSAILAYEGLKRRSYAWLAFAGAASGVAFWIRPEGLSVTIVSVGLILFAPMCRRALQPRRPMVAAASVAMASLALVVPYLLVKGELSGKISSKPGYQLALSRTVTSSQDISSTHSASVTEPPTDRKVKPTPSAGRSRTAFGATLCQAASLFIRRFAEFFLVLLIPLAVGVIERCRRAADIESALRWALCLFHVGLLHVLYFLGGYLERRHLLPMAALLAPNIGLGTWKIVDWVKIGDANRRQLRWLSAVGVVIVLSVLLLRTLRSLNYSQLPAIAAAKWIHDHTRPDDVILSNSQYLLNHLAIYGRENCRLLTSDEDWADAIERARHGYIAVEMEPHGDYPWSVENWRRRVDVVLTFHGDRTKHQRNVLVHEVAPVLATRSLLPVKVR